MSSLFCAWRRQIYTISAPLNSKSTVQLFILTHWFWRSVVLYLKFWRTYYQIYLILYLKWRQISIQRVTHLSFPHTLHFTYWCCKCESFVLLTTRRRMHPPFAMYMYLPRSILKWSFWCGATDKHFHTQPPMAYSIASISMCSMCLRVMAKLYPEIRL